MSQKQKLISVVVPVYNEEENLTNFHTRLSKAAESAPYDLEILFVNDGSYDKSMEVLKKLSQEDGRIRVLNLSRNSGSYAAIEAGFTYAKGDAVMAISADLQDPPEIINEFYPQWASGEHDIVWGVREKRDDPFFKSLFAGIFYWVIRKIAISDFPVDGMDIGLFDRMIIEAYLNTRDKNSIPFFSIYSMGFRQKRIPYHRKDRVAGESGWPFWKRVACAMEIILSYSYTPIRAMTVLGTTSAVLAFIYGVGIIITEIFFAGYTPGWSSLAVIVLFIGGVQMIFLGIIAEYLWHVNKLVKGKPAYYVMEEVSKESKSSSSTFQTELR